MLSVDKYIWRVLLALVAGLTLVAIQDGRVPTPALAATFTVNSTGNGVDVSIGNGVCETATLGECTLRAAIAEAQSFGGGGNTIFFSIPGAGVHTIAVTGSALPAITVDTIIDATSEPGWTAATPQIQVTGGGPVCTGFQLAGGDSEIHGLIISGFPCEGIHVTTDSGRFTANWIGLNSTGTAAAGNGDGILISGGSAEIGSSDAGMGNVISGNTDQGIDLQPGADDTSVIIGNYIGTDKTGMSAIPNVRGIHAYQGVRIGGFDFDERNVISGNTSDGIRLQSVPVSETVEIYNNIIGRNADDTAALGNQSEGIYMQSVSGDVIVGSPAAPNIIASHGGRGMNAILGSPTITYRANSIYSNLSGLVGYGASPVAAPVITSVITNVAGTACANCIIDVFADATTHAKTYLGSTTADANGNWVFYSQIAHANLRATASLAGNNGTSVYSSSFAVPACGTICTEGFWQVDYSGSVTRSCSTWINQVGSDAWGHLSCTDGTEADLQGTVDQVNPPYDVTVHSRMPDNGVLCADALDNDIPGDVAVNDGCPAVGAAEAGGQCTNASDDDADLKVNDGCPTVGLYDEVGYQSTSVGTFDGASTTTGTSWTCVVGCAGSGTWSATRVLLDADVAVAPGGTETLGSGTPSTTIYNPSTETITVRAIAIEEPTGGGMARTGYELLPHGLQLTTPVQMTVDFTGAQNAIPNNNCWGLALEFQDPDTELWEFESLVDCENGGVDSFTAEIYHFSVARFAFCQFLPITDTVTPNADRNFIELGAAAAYDDVTRAYSDSMPDSCDPDDDNDGRSDEDELSGQHCGSSLKVTNPQIADTDGDTYLDGPECDTPTDPTLSSSKPTVAQCGGTGDLDADGLNDFTENCRLFTDSREPDTDRYLNSRNINGTFADVCSDLKETGSINADSTINAVDLGQVAQRFGASTSPNYSIWFDVNKDGAINANDLSRVAQAFGGCPAI